MGWDHIAFRLGPGGHPALRSTSGQLVRRALAYGIDRGALARQLYPDLPSVQPVQNFIFAPGQRFYEPHWKTYTYQPAKARRLLGDAGCRRGADGIYICSGERLSLRLFTTPGLPVRARTVELVQAQLLQAGVEVVPCFVATSSALRAGPPERRLRPRALPADRSRSRSGRTCRTSGAAGSPSNYTGYCHRLVTQEFVQSQLIVDAKQRARALNGADRQMAKARPGTSPLSGSLDHSRQWRSASGPRQQRDAEGSLLELRGLVARALA